MPFYNEIKQDIRREHGDADSASEQDDDTEEDPMAFDQLKQEAEKSGQDDAPAEKQAAPNDVEIEVMGDAEDPSPAQDASASSTQPAETTSQPAASAAQREQTAPAQQEARETATQAATPTADPAAAEPDVSGTGDARAVELLETIAEQNQEMLSVLRGIKRGLDRNDTAR